MILEVCPLQQEKQVYCKGHNWWHFHQQVMLQPCLSANLGFLIEEVRRKLNPTHASWNYLLGPCSTHGSREKSQWRLL